MAKSDNVIRAGLTPKFKDVTTLVSSLTYLNKAPEEIIFLPQAIGDVTRAYVPPVDEFAVDVLEFSGGACRYNLPAKGSGSILIVIKGVLGYNGQLMKAGSIYFVPAMLSLPLIITDQEVLCYRAYVSLRR